ncbi:MAG: DUF1232 domain-containing protein [Candidatus Marinimicrobia bacterium]|jgi:hypothetical protein|nr:DUF1232 domain-containing protein [Candidatus Neomarinimicrobiota bacterium]
MSDNKLFQLTDEDKEKYKSSIKKINISTQNHIIKVAVPKINKIIAGNVTNVEAQLIDDVVHIIGLLENYPELTEHMKQRMIFALSYFCDENDEIPDIIPGIGYLDDALVAQWIVDGIMQELPPLTEA